MSKNINPVAGSTIVFTNKASAISDAEKVWNTGLNAVTGADAVIADAEPWTAEKVASIRLYKSNLYAFLQPGDTFTIETKTAEETLYYSQFKSDLLDCVVTVPASV